MVTFIEFICMKHIKNVRRQIYRIKDEEHNYRDGIKRKEIR